MIRIFQILVSITFTHRFLLVGRLHYKSLCLSFLYSVRQSVCLCGGKEIFTAAFSDRLFFKFYMILYYFINAYYLSFFFFFFCLSITHFVRLSTIHDFKAFYLWMLLSLFLLLLTDSTKINLYNF